MLGAVQFGAFSLAYVTYGFALSASRGLATAPLMVRFSGTDVRPGAVPSPAVPGPPWLLAWPRAPACSRWLRYSAARPGRLPRPRTDTARFALAGQLAVFVLRAWTRSQAFINDTIWALTLLPALAVLRVTGHANVFWFVLAWGITGPSARPSGHGRRGYPQTGWRMAMGIAAA